MKFSLALPNSVRVKALAQPWELTVTGVDQTVMAKRVDELGYDMIVVPEHFIVPKSHVELSGPHYFHSTVAQAFIAGATQRIRVNSFVTVLPLQHPVVMAKALSTADWMSDGRITVTFGVGWDAEEFNILGVPFGERGRMADEYLAAILELWTSDSPSFDGRYVSFHDVAFEPKPVQKPHLPIWIGGDARPVLERAARFASGWSPFLTKPVDIPAKLDFIKSQPTYDGRDFEVVYGLGTSRVGEGHVVIDDPTQRPGMSAQEIIDQIGWLAQLGVTMSGLPVPPVADVNAYLDYAQWVIKDIKPKLQ
ncbi:TIGR03619 family F420-dependent LLM class oxidoreductase [Mycobacterium vicinigordonae]|uniref:TIGR03619 family F420-dependent LLM class oxidoreductase n=1 Tax=Mycobacterium vicinigordonae TaxID=1719132 RepID=A0A7D6E9K0_9MYCO|nr:TIGR03619 family F420-dependent LLM class oxidoreductase [Mycobacterium vicinigordonae]QLL09663.1 TIGR03619 family F420-dependent LLM class oxidoreductase [Mycobacterium vicinigordonae]